MFHSKKILYSSMLILLPLLLPIKLFALDENNDDKNVQNHQEQSSSGTGPSEERNDLQGNISWQNIRAWLANLLSTNNNRNLPLPILSGNPSEGLSSKLLLGIKFGLSNYLMDSYFTIGNAPSHKLKFDHLYNSYKDSKYFHSSDYLSKEVWGKGYQLTDCDIEKGFLPYSGTEYDKYPHSFSNQDNVITVGMMRVGSPPLDGKIINLLEKIELGKDEKILEMLLYSDYLEKIASSLEILERGTVLTRDNRDNVCIIHIIIKAGEFSEELAEILVELKNKNKLNSFSLRLIEVAKNSLEKAKEIVLRAGIVQANSTKLRDQDILAGKSALSIAAEISSKVDQLSLDNLPQAESRPLSGDTHWYNDDEINTLLQRYVGTKVGEGLMHAISLAQREGATAAENLRDREAQLRELEHASTIILPINLGTFNPNGEGYAGNH